MRLLQEQISRLKVRLVNSIARAVVQLVDDSRRLQRVQLGVLAGEDIDDGERFQQYGFSSVPLDGAEAVVLFPAGDRAHPLVIAVDDRRHRPTDGKPGEVCVYSNTGATIRLLETGDIEIQPAPGRELLVRDEGGGVDRLVKVSEFSGHTHGAGLLVAPSGGGTVTGTTAGAAAVTGTTRLRVQ